MGNIALNGFITVSSIIPMLCLNHDIDAYTSQPSLPVNIKLDSTFSGLRFHLHCSVGFRVKPVYHHFLDSQNVTQGGDYFADKFWTRSDIKRSIGPNTDTHSSINSLSIVLAFFPCLSFSVKYLVNIYTITKTVMLPLFLVGVSYWISISTN